MRTWQGLWASPRCVHVTTFPGQQSDTLALLSLRSPLGRLPHSLSESWCSWKGWSWWRGGQGTNACPYLLPLWRNQFSIHFIMMDKNLPNEIPKPACPYGDLQGPTRIERGLKPGAPPNSLGRSFLHSSWMSEWLVFLVSRWACFWSLGTCKVLKVTFAELNWK